MINLLTEEELKAFSEKNCQYCGTQRCMGVYDEEWREGCTEYIKENTKKFQEETNKINESC